MPGGEGEAIALEGELARHEPVLRQDGGQARERVVAGVRGEEQDQRSERLEQVEGDAAVAVDRRGDLADDRLGHGLVERHDAEAVGDERDADEQDRQEHCHRHERLGGVPRLGRLERRHAVGDGLGTGQRDRTRGECPEQQQDPDRLERVRGAGQRVGRRCAFTEDEDAEHADPDHEQRGAHEQVGRDREDVSRLAQAAQVPDGDQQDRADADRDRERKQLRHGRRDLLDGRRGRHRDGHDVVHEQGACRDESRQHAEICACHGVGAAAGRVGEADLAIACGDDREQQRDGDRHGQAEEQRACPREHEDAEDLLGRVGRRADGVRAEDRERLLLRQPLLDVLVVRQRTPEQRAAGPGERTSRPRSRARRRLAGDHLARAGVPEIGGVRPLDPDPPVACLAPLQRPSTADHASRGPMWTVTAPAVVPRQAEGDPDSLGVGERARSHILHAGERGEDDAAHGTAGDEVGGSDELLQEISGCFRTSERQADHTWAVHVSTLRAGSKVPGRARASRAPQGRLKVSRSGPWTRYPMPGSVTIRSRRAPVSSAAASLRRSWLT